MKRLSWMALIVVFLLAAFGCGTDEDEAAQIRLIEGDLPPVGDLVDPVDSGEAGGVLDIETLLPIGGVVSGDLNFEPVDDSGVGFTSPFTLNIVPIDSKALDKAFFALFEGMEFQIEMDPMFDVAAILSQPRGDGTTQDTYGRAGLLPDGVIRVITAGGDDNFLETFVLDLEPVLGDPFEEWFLVPVTGANVGVDRDTTIDESVSAAFSVLAEDFLAEFDPTGDYLYGFSVRGEMSPGAPEETVASESEISGVDSGTFEGSSFVKLSLKLPVSAEEALKRWSVEFTTNEGDRIVAAYNLEPDGNAFSTSFCVGEGTPSCPDGIFGIVAEPVLDGMGLVFFYPDDAWDNATNPTYSAFIETGPADSPEDRTRDDFQGGERFPVNFDESDPC